MKDRTRLGTPNQRRANRVFLQRPVHILSPLNIVGETVNISAVGILVHLEAHRELKRGLRVAIEIPRLDGDGTLQRQGRVVRIEPYGAGMAVAIELA
jgi:hypothetical protein